MEKYPSLAEGIGLENRQGSNVAGVRIPLSPNYDLYCLTIPVRLLFYIGDIMSNLVELKYQNKMIIIDLLGGELINFSLGRVNYIREKDEIWNRCAPHLFPIVGRLKDNEYCFSGKTYPMNGHGFLRDSEFYLIKKTKNMIVIGFNSNDNTKKIYPFDFMIMITYKLTSKGLIQMVKIINKGNNKMHFNIGEHPGFNLFSDIENYQVIFNKKESFISPSVSLDKLLDFSKPNVQYKNIKSIRLNNELFIEDAIINSNVKSSKVILKSNDYSLQYSFKGYKTFAIWTKPNNSFICLEPWIGYADKVDSNKELLNKGQLITLNKNSSKKFITKIKVIKELKN